MAERQLLAQQIRKEEGDRNSVKETEYLLKVRELEKQLDDQRKLAEEMKRKAEQGSMQLQGEAQELLLEELLRDRFPYDTIGEVGKGVEGADCIQTVFNHVGTECGKIIFESKRTKAFNNAWIEKLKADMRNKGADVAILVTGVYPKEMACFGERDGVWICSFSKWWRSPRPCGIPSSALPIPKKQKKTKAKKCRCCTAILPEPNSASRLKPS
jgi:hypothetical protein